MIFRGIKENDVNQLATLATYVWCDTYCKEGIKNIESQYMINEFSIEKFLEILTCTTKTCLVAENGNRILGLCILNFKSKYKNQADFGDEIENFYVFPKIQRNGIGNSLLKCIFEKYGPNKWLTTWVHNYNAINFYKKNNFEIIGTAEFNLFDEVHQNHVLHHK